MTNEYMNLLVICGPNASGKTRLAVSLAADFSGEIVSADSRQVYRGMDIGTGKDLAEYSTSSGMIPYHLIDIAEPSEIYTLYHYQQDCYRVIEDIWSRRKLPIMIGGTGLYIEAVLKRYRIPNVPGNPRLRTFLMKKEKKELTRRLESLDPNLYNSTDLSSKKRIVRSLEVAEYAQNHPVQWGRRHPPDVSPVIICIQWPRAVLIERINCRLKQRFNDGMINEVQKLLDSGIPSDRFAYFGMEYKHVARYLKKEISYDIMVKELSRDIHRLAKRQMTYFKGFERRGLPIHWVVKADMDKAVEIIERHRFCC